MRHLLVLSLIWLLAACASIPTPDERRDKANRLAAAHGWRAEVIPVDALELTAYVPERVERTDVLTVYIEGDGLAWINSATPSDDPTPRDPLALRLALAQRSGNVAYLARPCQFQRDEKARTCSQVYWTGGRFAPDVIAATNLALDLLKLQFGAEELQMVGYSGGGAVATLVASQRQDVSLLVTVAGNLDTQAWVRYHHLSPLSGSLNPADASHEVARIRQIHFSGEDDRIVPPEMVKAFASRFSLSERPPIRVMKGYDHVCCWVENWPSLWEDIQ